MAKDEHRLTNAENKLKKQRSADPADDHQDPQDPPKPPATGDTPEWAKKMLEDNEKFRQDLQELKTGKIIENKKQQARKVFEGNETLKGLKETVKEKWFNRIDVNSETPIEDQISDLEEEYNDLVQVSADHKRSPGVPPEGKGGSKPTDAELDAIAKGL